MLRALLTLALAILTALPAAAGMVYEATTTIESSQPGQSQRMTVRGWVEGEAAKVVFQEADGPLFESGSYLLTGDGGRTIFLVDPKEKTYMAWDVGAMLGAAGQIMKGMGPMFQMSFRDLAVETVASEPGPEIHGYPTTHSRYRTSYVLDMKVIGMKQEMATETVQDVWWTTALADPGFGVWLRQEPPRTGVEDLDELIRQQIGQVEGFPLKTVAVTVSTDKKGRETRSTTNTEVTSLREEAIPAGTFELPAGYQRMEMPDLGAVFGRQ